MKKHNKSSHATVTSRLIEVIHRGFIVYPPFQRPLPLVTVRAL
jgi:hypothetical protein